VRRDVSIEQLGDLMERPLLATLATYRQDGSVLLSPVWHEWRDGGFLVAVGAHDAKLRHLRRDPRACIVVAENEGPFRGIEVSGWAEIDAHPGHALEAFRRIAIRYLGPERGTAFAGDSGAGLALVSLQPGTLRTWDFLDDPALTVLEVR
jgi:PPOX class probable F420-dependent enzyme